MRAKRLLAIYLALVTSIGLVGCDTADSDISSEPSFGEQQSSTAELQPSENLESNVDTSVDNLHFNLYRTAAFAKDDTLIASITFPEDDYYTNSYGVFVNYYSQLDGKPLALIGLALNSKDGKNMDGVETRPFLLNLETGELHDYGNNNTYNGSKFRKAVITKDYVYPTGIAVRDTPQTIQYTYYSLDTLEPQMVTFQFAIPTHFEEVNDREEYLGVCHNEDNGDWYVFYRTSRWGPGENPASHAQAYRDHDLNCVVFDGDGNMKSDLQTGLVWPSGHGSIYNGRFIIHDNKIYFSYVSEWTDEENQNIFEAWELSIAEYDPYINSARMITSYWIGTQHLTMGTGSYSANDYVDDTFMRVQYVDETGVTIDIPSNGAIVRHTVALDGRESTNVDIRPRFDNDGRILIGNGSGGEYYYISQD